MGNQCYSYADGNFEYVGATVADEDPLTPGVFHPPRNTTYTAPPTIPSGQQAVFDDPSWKLVADHRGETWYDGAEAVTIEQLGDPTTFTPALSATAKPDLAAYARYRQAAILGAGSTFNVAASGQPAKMILCDGTNPTRADLALLVLNAQANPNSTQTWVDNHGVSTVLAASEVIQLAQLAGNWMSATYPTLGNVLAGLAASPPTITTTAQIDSAFSNAQAS